MTQPREVIPGELASAPRLTLVHSPDTALGNASVPLCGELLLLGRDVETPGLAIADPRASRLHARCLWDGRMRSLRIVDMASRNGTFVNGRRVDTVLLTHGDVIRVGDSLLIYHEESAIERVRQRALTLAPSALTVLIQGDTGTGKNDWARRMHEASGRRGPLVTVSCGALPPERAARELFGELEPGAGASASLRPGLVQSAEGGTLLLDDIGDCAIEVQRSLLRLLEARVVRPLGADRERAVDVRVMATAPHDLATRTDERSFRGDLLARLSKASLELPPLRERREELLGLAGAFAREEGGALQLSADAAEALLTWHWPFNLRELRSLVQTWLVVRGENAVLDLGYLNASHPGLASAVASRASAAPPAHPESALSSGPQQERKRLRGLLEQHAGNVSRVAKELGKPRAQIYRWMDALGLSAQQFRK